MEMPYPWLPLLFAGGFAFGAVLNGIRVANGEPKASHIVGLVLYSVLSLMFAFITWMAWFGPPLA